MGKKRTRSSYTSKGQRPNVNKGILKAIKEDRSPFFKEECLRKAWRAGKNPWVTVKNDGHSGMSYVKKRANSVWGNPKNTWSIYGGKGG